jgi:hypothetical protein
MNIRPFDWRDLPVLHRYRSECIFLDSMQYLMHGPLRVPTGTIFAYLIPGTGISTYYCTEDGKESAPILSQVNHPVGTSSARLSYITPKSALPEIHLVDFFDHIVKDIGDRGAIHLLAEVDEHEPFFEMLHQAGFAIYARQRIWKLEENHPETAESPWKTAREADGAGIRFLYSNLVPALVQQVETAPSSRFRGMVYYQGTELFAYVELRYGLQGIWAQPFIHPDAESAVDLLHSILQEVPFRRSRPVYVCLRSYQSWLEPMLEEMQALPGPQQAVMVRHLAVTRRVTQPLALPTLNGKTAEPTAPIAQIKVLNEGHDRKKDY